MTRTRTIVALSIAVLAALGGCSSGGDSDSVTVGKRSRAESAAANHTTDEDSGITGSGLLVLNGEEMPFDVAICFEGDDFELNKDLRLHVEGRGEDRAGRAYEVQLVRTQTPERHTIDVIRVRHDDRPVGASHEAQRVQDLATGEVSDLWGDRTTPLFNVSRDGDVVSVVASAVFGDYRGNGGDPKVIGDGELEASCTVTSG